MTLVPARSLPVVVGNSRWNIEPLLALDDTQIFPSWFSMIERQIESPIPIPFSLVVNSSLACTRFG
jgi:hypothetical protein